MSESDDSRRSSTAYGILLTLDTHFITSLCTLERVLDRIHVCSMQPQSSSGTMQSAVDAIESLMYQCDHRPIPQADERFEEVWERASAIIKETALPAPQKLVRKTRRQNQAAGEMDRNLECPNEWIYHLFDYLLIVVHETLQKRFSDTNKEIMIYVGCLYLDGEKFLDLKLLLPLATTFRVDTEALKPQVETCKLMLMRMRELENPAVEGILQ